MYKICLLFTSLFITLGYIVYFWNWKKKHQSFYPKKRPLIFGHRGSPSHITENTIASFKKAINQGVDGLEFDIRLSKDKQIVIFHDSNLKRMSGVDKKTNNLKHTGVSFLAETNKTDVHWDGEIV